MEGTLRAFWHVQVDFFFPARNEPAIGRTPTRHRPLSAVCSKAVTGTLFASCYKGDFVMKSLQRQTGNAFTRFLLLLAALCSSSTLVPVAAVAAPFAYVANSGSNSVTVIDTLNNAVVATVAVESQPHGVAITPDGKFAYVANSGSNSVSVIDTLNNAVITNVPVGSFPFGVAATPDGRLVYVVNLGSDNASVIDTASNTVVVSFKLGRASFWV